MSEGEITRLLTAHRKGDPEAFKLLIPLVYEELRRVSRRQLARLRPGSTLDTTALVHETYLRLVDQTLVEISDRNHFYSIAARAMRQILVDYARRKWAMKIGGVAKPVSLEQVQVGMAQQVEILLAIDHALSKLSSLDERLTRVFECRFFAGLTEKETAEALEISPRTVQRDWVKSKAWLRRELAPT